MPQMMPLNWLSLMLFFIVIFYLFNCMNYFSFMYKNKSNKINTSKLYLNWKW
uniref:ATP synthase complex subunit 8 n=1 Tax=Tenebrionoidea sp. 5 KM-2017 TaxID=2219483 RepID=A0A346RG54_9CUCU|nr:ATP synthase F0 subunit 8 [Tenebrionoidea sp. 5 KM-2017]